MKHQWSLDVTVILFCLQPCWTLWSLGSRELALKSFWRIFFVIRKLPSCCPSRDFLGWEGRTGFDWVVWGSCRLWCVNKAKPGNFGAKHSPLCVYTSCVAAHSFCSTHENPVNCVWVTESLWCVLWLCLGLEHLHGSSADFPVALMTKCP